MLLQVRQVPAIEWAGVSTYNKGASTTWEKARKARDSEDCELEEGLKEGVKRSTCRHQRVKSRRAVVTIS